MKQSTGTNSCVDALTSARHELRQPKGLPLCSCLLSHVHGCLIQVVREITGKARDRINICRRHLDVLVEDS